MTCFTCAGTGIVFVRRHVRLLTLTQADRFAERCPTCGGNRMVARRPFEEEEIDKVYVDLGGEG